MAEILIAIGYVTAVAQLAHQSVTSIDAASKLSHSIRRTLEKIEA